jgi:ABC-2 type transport system permease protein
VQSIVGNEILKTSFKWRSAIAFIAVAVIVPLVMIGVKLQGDAVVKGATRALGQDFLLLGNILNGYFVTALIMNSLWVHIPFLITLGAGDQLAGEATAGTYRILLIRPASRTRILFAKYVTTLLYASMVVLFLVAISVGLGMTMFGTGVMLVQGKVLTVIPESEAPWRLLLACGLAAWGMWSVASLAFLLSSLVDNGIGPIIGTMAVIIVSYVISAIPVDLFRMIRPYLFTTYLNIWQKAMERPIPWGDLLHSGLVLGAFSVGFFLITWYIFVRKDILS